jgi:hypothetical protein
MHATAHVDAAAPAHVKATSQRLYGYLLIRVDKWLHSGWATPEQRRALAAGITAGLQDGDQ